MSSVARLCVVIGLFFTSSWTVAQSNTGFPLFGSFSTFGPDTINQANLNVHVKLPIVHKAGRGLAFDYGLNYDSTIWSQVTTVVNGQTTTKWQSSIALGWLADNIFGSMRYFVFAGIPGLPQCPSTSIWYTDPSGTVHPFISVLVSTESICGPLQATTTTTDGSGYSLTVQGTNASGGTRSPQFISLYDSSGNSINLNYPDSITDPNGNSISTISSTINYADTLGMTVLSVNTAGNNPINYTYTGPNGTPEMVSANYSPYTVATKFGCSGISEYPPTTQQLISSVSLPDGTAYIIKYEQTPSMGTDVTGRIAEIDLPTGGSIRYQYTGAHGGLNCGDGTAAGLTRTTPDGSWTYTRNSTFTTTTIQDPAGNQTSVQFVNGAEVLKKVYQGTSSSGTLLETVTTCFNSTAAPCSTPTGPNSSDAPPRALTSITQLNGGKQMQTVTYFGLSCSNSACQLNLPTEVDTYDFGSASPTQVTTFAYASLSSNILDRWSCIQVTAGVNGNTCGTVTSNTKSITNNTWDATGNLKQVSSWVQGTTYLNRSFTYSSGLLQTTTDVNSNPTSYQYQTCGPNNVQAFVSSTSSGGLNTAYTWDCNGGVIAQVSDANGHPTRYGYVNQSGTPDPLWRVNSVTDPLNNVTSTTYTPATSSTPETVETALIFGTSTVDTLKTFDGLGRLVTSQRRTAPGAPTFDNTVQYTYGWTLTGPVTGRVTTQTIAGGSALTTTQFDALGRKASVSDGGGGTLTLQYTQNDVLQTVGPAPQVKKQTEYDAFGRIASVCEATAGTTSWPGGNCAQTSGQTGYWTKYTYDNPANSLTVTQNAQGSPVQTRSFTQDGLGRMTSETNPETNSIPFAYTYDTDGTCGTSNGDLVKKVDAANNVICFAYDALHRNIGITYPSGPNAGLTPAKYFQYDTEYFGSTGTNIMGRLVAAATCQSPTSCAGNSVTLEEFGYSPRGEVTDVWEVTPHSAGTYHITSSYWANGQLNTLKGVSLPTLTYGLDGEGRPSTVSASTGVSPVSSTLYNSAGQATDVTFGSGDPVHFGFDPSTGRMTQYKLTINGTATHGDPAWNPNGTLGSLTITDPFNASDAQTCNYGYDDMARLAGVNCLQGTTNVWNQNFTYDPFGNITKSGTISWQPGYNESTNQYLTSANCATTGAAPCYDQDGNLLKDGTDHVYTWDAEGHPVTLDSRGMVYDARGREVELQNSGTNTEFVYGPTGKLALMNGQTQNKAYVPLPGGTQVKYTGSSISTYRLPDWLGSLRAGSNPNRTYSWGVAFAPFGEQYAQSGGPALSFTGEEGTADSITDEYDFLNRKLHSAQGRWISPDPAGLAAASFGNPQSWNRYAYVQNGPLNAIDPLGLACFGPQKSLGLCNTAAGFGSNGFIFASWNEFELMNIPVVAYGWIHGFIDSDPTGPNRAEVSGGYVTAALGYYGWYWGASQVGFEDPSQVSVLINPSAQDVNRAFCQAYGECPPPARIIDGEEKHQQDVQNAQTWCNIGVSVGEEGGVGDPGESTDTGTTVYSGDYRLNPTGAAAGQTAGGAGAGVKQITDHVAGYQGCSTIK